MIESKKNLQGKKHREEDPVIDVVFHDQGKFLVVESLAGLPCSSCCFNPCSTKPEGFEPCVCIRNKYRKNIYYKKILRAGTIDEVRAFYGLGRR